MDAGKDGAGVGDEERSWLDLEAELTSVGLGELLEGHLDRRTDDLRVRTLLRRDARDLVATAEIEGLHGRETADEGEARRGDFLPDDRVAAGADVRVDADNLQAVLLYNGLSLICPLMPNTKGGVRSANVGLTGTARATARVKAKTDFMAWEGLTDPFELQEGASVHVHSFTKESGEIFRDFLRRERDTLGRDTREHRAPDFPARTGIEMEALVREDLQDRGIRAGLHGKSDRYAEGVREGQHGVSLGLQGGLIVNKAGGAMGRGDLAGRIRKKEAVIFHGSVSGGLCQAGPSLPAFLRMYDTACLPSPRPLG